MQYWLNTSVLAASHTTELAEKWGRRVRNAVNDDGLVLGIGISADNQAAGRWALTTGAEYYAAGVGTGIAGFRAGLGMIDDPIRSRQDADSELIRDRIWEWYINDFRTRLVPGAPEILIQTRWHEDDLAGRALQHNDWRVVSLPAEAEPNDPLGRKVGEFLWADGDYGYAEQLAELKKNTPARTWSALYQQRPAPEDGDYFKAEWLRPYDKAPPLDTMRIYGGSDYAVTADGGDYTVHAVVGLDPEGRMYLLDLWRKQAGWWGRARSAPRVPEAWSWRCRTLVPPSRSGAPGPPRAGRWSVVVRSARNMHARRAKVRICPHGYAATCAPGGGPGVARPQVPRSWGRSRPWGLVRG
jgi:hypothetical protein